MILQQTHNNTRNNIHTRIASRRRTCFFVFRLRVIWITVIVIIDKLYVNSARLRLNKKKKKRKKNKWFTKLVLFETIFINSIFTQRYSSYGMYNSFLMCLLLVPRERMVKWRNKITIRFQCSFIFFLSSQKEWRFGIKEKGHLKRILIKELLVVEDNPLSTHLCMIIIWSSIVTISNQLIYTMVLITSNKINNIRVLKFKKITSYNLQINSARIGRTASDIVSILSTTILARHNVIDFISQIRNPRRKSFARIRKRQVIVYTYTTLKTGSP